jgi:Glycine/serine hydroxymethyltransferase
MHIPPIPAVETADPEIARLVSDEARRQYEKARLIPSENYVSVAVLEASGSVLTNKYSEGYPGRRYYEGQQFIDQVETIARDRAGRCSAWTTPTSSRIPARPRTSRSTWPSPSRATR